MIQETTYYEIICDKCGERLTLDAISAWQTEEEAADVIGYCDWQETEDGKVYCPCCADSEIDYVSEEE